MPDPELELPDCAPLLLQAYFEWGHQEGVDPAPDTLGDDQQRRFIKRGYGLYDGYPVPCDDEITIGDVCASITINSYIVLPDVRRFLSRRQEISALLQDVAPDLCLLNASENLIDQIGDLVDTLSEIEHIGFGKVTKVLHKKRPKLIPVIDGYVLDALHKNFPWLMRGSAQRSFSQVLRVYRNAQRHVQELLLQLTVQLRQEQEIDLTEGRALSYLIWNWRRQFERLKRPCTLRAFWGSAGQAGRDAARDMWEG